MGTNKMKILSLADLITTPKEDPGKGPNRHVFDSDYFDKYFTEKGEKPGWKTIKKRGRGNPNWQ